MSDVKDPVKAGDVFAMFDPILEMFERAAILNHRLAEGDGIDTDDLIAFVERMATFAKSDLGVELDEDGGVISREDPNQIDMEF